MGFNSVQTNEVSDEPPQLYTTTMVNDRDMCDKRAYGLFAWLFYCPRKMAFGIPSIALVNAYCRMQSGVMDNDIR